jgi:tetratricopeptide (TPR) repeat protein
MSTEIYPPNLLAKKLNNRAALLITKHSYDESIALLARALKLTEQVYGESPPSCNTLSLDYCLRMEQESYLSILDNEEKGGWKKAQNRIGDEHNHRHVSLSRQDHEQLESALQSQEGYLYTKPLLVPKCCIEDEYYMGIVLTLMILFNLALAHNLKAIFLDDVERCKKVLDQSLKLYELAYQLHIDSEESAGSLRFTMIIANNLGQIHKLSGNDEKHQMCLHHLLSAIMYMVDSYGHRLDSSEMDGFYRNILPIMISGHCAEAA